MRRLVLTALGTLSLAACDSAGTVLDSSARIAAVEQCQQVAEGAGIVGGAVNSVCNCAADKWLAKPVADRIDISPESIRSIISECAGTDATPAANDSADGSF